MDFINVKGSSRGMKNAVQTTALKENWPRVGLGLGLWFGEQFSLGAIVLEPIAGFQVFNCVKNICEIFKSTCFEHLWMAAFVLSSLLHFSFLFENVNF